MRRLAWVLVAVALWAAAGCGCADSEIRHRDGGPSELDLSIDAPAPDTCCAAPDAAPDQGRDWSFDTSAPADAAMDGSDMAMLDVADTSPLDSSAPDSGEACLDACLDAVEPDAPADAGPDSGCRPGRIACPGPDGILHCIDPMEDDCNCAGCGNRCAACIGGMCLGGCTLPDQGRCFALCDLPSDEEARMICVELPSNDEHCGECFHRCAPGEYCSASACYPIPEG